ncbi:hypothetical protein Tco_1047160 [Tanacetum coccineum]
MTIAEYELYIAKQGLRKNPLNDHAYSFTLNFYDQSPYTPNPQPENKELNFEEDITVEDVERLRQLLTPTVHTLPKLNHVVQPCVPLLPSPDEVKVVMEEEPNYDVDSMSIQVFIINDDLIQPLIPQPIHTTPPDDDYVAPTTKLILEELLEESEPFIHIKPLSPLYGVFKSPKSSTKPYKVEREMTSPPCLLVATQMLLEEAELEHGLEHAISSSFRANPREFSVPFLTLPTFKLYA